MTRSRSGGVRGLRADRERASLVQRLVQFHLGDVAAGVEHAGDAARAGFAHAAEQGCEDGVARGLRNNAPHHVLRAFLEDAGRLAGCVANDRTDDDAVHHGVGRRARYARERERFRVRPKRMSVEGVECHRPIRNRAIEQRFRRQSVGGNASYCQLPPRIHASFGCAGPHAASRLKTSSGSPRRPNRLACARGCH